MSRFHIFIYINLDKDTRIDSRCRLYWPHKLASMYSFYHIWHIWQMLQTYMYARHNIFQQCKQSNIKSCLPWQKQKRKTVRLSKNEWYNIKIKYKSIAEEIFWTISPFLWFTTSQSVSNSWKFFLQRHLPLPLLWFAAV